MEERSIRGCLTATGEIPKFCDYCGSPISVNTIKQGFHPETGKPIFGLSFRCSSLDGFWGFLAYGEGKHSCGYNHSVSLGNKL